MTDSETAAALDAAIAAILDTKSRAVYDVTIVCTTDDFQAEYWMKRLSEGVCKKESSDPFPMVLAVSEDWGPGGAGNGLGTLYAYQKSCALASKLHGIDLASLLKESKVSAALFHTAGKGTRLAPLPASENNNKPGVKIPFCHELSDGSNAPITVLEAVVKQTGIYAPSRRGRLSVYWGDQVFIPSAPFAYKPTHHIDIMCTLLGETAPTAEEWVAQGLDKYGVIAVAKGEQRNAAQVEKVDHATAVKMLSSLGNIGQVGPSLGSFSVSAQILKGLCDEYATELTEKVAKLDTDPHFWMPLTLPAADYASLMAKKGVEEADSIAHHSRMAKMKESFDLDGMGLFGAVDVGAKACWWDYGLVKLYSTNNLKLKDNDADADLLRKFLGVTSRRMYSTIGDSVTVDEDSCVFGSTISAGSITNSVLAGVKSPEVEADGAIIVNCTAKKIKAGKGAILYNLIDTSDEGIVAEDGAVRVAVMEESGESMLLKSKMDIDGGKAWKIVVEENPMSFEAVHGKNKDSNVTVIEQKRKVIYDAAAASFGL
uniref:Uncharacterized protein n=1 Tax=Attheya septentrionalis TaxID=420275 RepID=A0A7S2XTE0_9STRA|mmetsp:Transcript_7315/g.13131  ORF Transcript_7315/g.13131 Transcript_7315/m.13131 type:complete len:541 (+) Transcript_7315:70-1692(+)